MECKCSKSNQRWQQIKYLFHFMVSILSAHIYLRKLTLRKLIWGKSLRNALEHIYTEHKKAMCTKKIIRWFYSTYLCAITLYVLANHSDRKAIMIKI